MELRTRRDRAVHPRWVAIGLGLGLGLQLLAWASDIGLFGGLSGFVIMGVIVGWRSPGDTVIEPGIAAFLIATGGFVLNHLLLSVLGIGLVLAVGYGVLGLGLGLVGGWVGERLQAVSR